MSIFLNRHKTIKLKRDRDYMINKQGYAILKNVNYDTVWVTGHTKLRATGSLNVHAKDKTKIISFDDVTVSLSDNAQCIANNNSKVNIWSKKTLVFAYDNSKIQFKEQNNKLLINEVLKIYKKFKKTGENFSKVDKLFKKIIKDTWIFDNSTLTTPALDAVRQFINR